MTDLERRLLDDLPALAALAGAWRAELVPRLSPGPLPAGRWDVLMHVLQGAGAVTRTTDGWRATDAFDALLRADAEGLRARTLFTAMAAADILDAAECLAEPSAFAARARTFGFFRYGRAMRTGAAALQDTVPWVRYVEALSRREAPALAGEFPVGANDRLLEIGGNTGIMARAILACHPGMTATVLDLPAVARLGAQDAGDVPRLTFLGGDARDTDWPPADAVLFKSVLHDWDSDTAVAFLARAAAHVPPGGRVVVCERGPVQDEPPVQGAGAAANLVFAPWYRDPAFYAAAMIEAGLDLLPARQVRLDMTFHITAGLRP